MISHSGNQQSFLQRFIVCSRKKSSIAYSWFFTCMLMITSVTSIIAQQEVAIAGNIALPVYSCNYIDPELQISGKIDDPLWMKAEVIKLQKPIDGKPGSFATKVRMLYSAKFLYVSFECEDDYVWGTLTKHDASVFTEECVEIFLCPSGKMRQYYELNVSPLNTVFDTFILNGRPTTGERSKMRSWIDFTCEGMIAMGNINGKPGVPGAKGCSAEYAIPFSSILGSDNLSPLPDECWKVNFYRIDTPKPGSIEFYSWSPTGANDFHRPWRFGTINFVKDKKNHETQSTQFFKIPDYYWYRSPYNRNGATTGLFFS